MTEENGYRGARALLDRAEPPTAIVCSSMIMALGIVRATRELGLEIPRDLSLVAHDDVFHYLKPESFPVPLTTTRSSIRAAGQRIAERLAARMSGLEAGPRAELWPVDLVVRGSIAGAPGLMLLAEAEPPSRGRVTSVAFGYCAGWHGFSPFSSLARQPYLSNIWPVSRAALPMPQPDSAASASKAIAYSHCASARAVGRRQRTVELRPAVAEQAPGGAVAAHGGAVEAGGQHRLAVAPGRSARVAGRSGDEGRAIVGLALAADQFGADAVGGGDRHQIGAGMAAHRDAPMLHGIEVRPSRLGADRGRVEQELRAHQRHGARRLREPLVPADADADRPEARRPDAKAGIARAEVELLR